MRRLIALITVLALLATLACAGLALNAWRIRHDADAAVAKLTLLPAKAAVTTPAAPVQPPPPAAARRIDVVWNDGDGRHLRSRIALDGTGGARVETMVNDQPMVSYRGQVHMRGDGTVVVDARDAAVSGPAAAAWIADSFTIRSDGSVVIEDGQHDPCSGYVAQESEPVAPP